VAEVTGYTPTSKILWRYNGLAGLGDGRLDNPGAAPLLDPAQLEALRDSEPPPDGGPGARWRTGSPGGAPCRPSAGSITASPGPDAAAAAARQSQGEEMSRSMLQMDGRCQD
jgi:hypothetical protein